MKVLAIIPARAGSIRLTKKNRKKLLGLPLINWTVNFVKKLNFVDDTLITTNDKYILEQFRDKSSAKVFDRPEYLASKSSNIIDVIIYELKRYEKKFSKVDVVLLLQPTSPIRKQKELISAFNKFKLLKKKKSIISVSKTKNINKRNFEIKDKNLILSKKEKKNSYQMNGNFYFATPMFLKKYRSFYYKRKTYPIILRDKKSSMDIDTLKDFKKAEKYLR